MKFQTTCATFADAIERALRVVPSSSSEPVFMQILMSVEDGRIDMTSTDNRRMLKASFQGEGETESGSIAMDSKRLKSLLPRIKAKGDMAMVLSVDNKLNVHMAMGATVYKVNGNPSEKFPLFPSLSEGEKEERTMESLELFRLLAFAGIPMKSSCPITFGDILIELFPSCVRIVSTDSVRLTVGQTEGTPLQEQATNQACIPYASAKDVSKLFKDSGPIRLELEPDSLTLHGKVDSVSLSLTCRQSEKTFPKYRRILEGIEENPIQLSCASKALVEALRDLEPIACENKHKVTLHTEELNPNTLHATAFNPELGEACASLSCMSRIDDSNLEPVGFSAKFILEFLDVMKKSDTITMGIRSSIYPALFRAKGEPRLSYILMPINI